MVKELERLKSQKIQGAEEGKNNSISLMTIHKSKGLEYPLIALVETADSWFRFDRYWLKANNGVYYCGTSQQMPKEDPAFSQVFTETQKTMHQETIRLLYVALTRSSQYLYVSAHKVKSSTGFGFYASLLRCFKRSSNLEEEGFRYFLKASQDLDLEAKSKVQVTSSAPVKYIKSISSHIETKVVHPHNSVAHEELVYSPSQGLRVSEALKALIGTFIHKTFELYCKGQDLNLELLWQQDLASDLVFIRERLSEKRRENLKNSVLAEIEINLNSEDFKKLLADSEEILPELPVVHMQGQKLLIGTLDLLVRKKDGTLLLVDYKTSECSEDMDLKQFCVERNYHLQLYSYRKAVAEIYPGSKIKSLIWLTKVQKSEFF